MDHLDFLGGVILFRTARDSESSCSPGSSPGLWLDIELETIDSYSGWTEEERRNLILTAKLADLIDDRKTWLLKEIEDGIAA